MIPLLMPPMETQAQMNRPTSNLAGQIAAGIGSVARVDKGKEETVNCVVGADIF